jgi:methyl acetate hydrolase
MQENMCPEIDQLQVLTGFDAAGQPQTRPPKRKITVNDLMLDTSGQSAPFTFWP